MVIYCDTGDIGEIASYANDERIQGFTTNPSLLRKFGISNYRKFARDVLGLIGSKPVSFEVLADEWEEMERQARELAALASNVWVKIPITNTRGESSRPLIEKLADLNLNVTAIMTADQVWRIRTAIKPHHILSIFNGRMTDTQVPPLDIHFLRAAIEDKPKFLWASARHIGNVRDAHRMHYDIITLSPELIAKLPLAGKDLTQYSLETVQQFYRDGQGIEW